MCTMSTTTTEKGSPMWQQLVALTTCTACANPMHAPIVLACGHSPFCAGCIVAKHDRPKKCPLCRVAISFGKASNARKLRINHALADVAACVHGDPEECDDPGFLGYRLEDIAVAKRVERASAAAKAAGKRGRVLPDNYLDAVAEHCRGVVARAADAGGDPVTALDACTENCYCGLMCLPRAKRQRVAAPVVGTTTTTDGVTPAKPTRWFWGCPAFSHNGTRLTQAQIKQNEKSELNKLSKQHEKLNVKEQTQEGERGGSGEGNIRHVGTHDTRGAMFYCNYFAWLSKTQIKKL